MALLLLIPACQNEALVAEDDCLPTAYDEMGPFYRANAPMRAKVGEGYILKGQVKSTESCRPLPGALLEFWLVNSEGLYDDAHRATVVADNKGHYFFESNRPTNYVSRRPHIHIRITAKGHEELVTQHYPQEGQTGAVFDLVLQKDTL